MKMYNEATGKIEDLPAMITVNGIKKYTKKMNESQLNAARWYKIKRASKPDNRYYNVGKETREIVDNICMISYEVIEKDIKQIKKRMLKDISDSFKKSNVRPKVDTGLGYMVDGSLDDISRLQIGKDLGIEFIVDVDGIQHDATADDYDIVITKIKEYGLLLYQMKWDREAEVNGLETIEDCILFEKSPYEVEQLIVDENGDAILDDDGNEQYETVTKYKNKCKDW